MPGGIYRETGQGGGYNQSIPKWKASTAVAPADLIFRKTADGYDYPASQITWDTNLATTQEDFHDVFRGVSMARRLTTQAADGGTGDGNILTSGEFCYPCDALGQAQKVGDLVGVAQGAGNTLANQKVVIVSTLPTAIGVLSRDAASGDTFLYFKIVPALAEGQGVQAIQ